MKSSISTDKKNIFTVESDIFDSHGISDKKETGTKSESKRRRMISYAESTKVKRRDTISLLVRNELIGRN